MLKYFYAVIDGTDGMIGFRFLTKHSRTIFHNVHPTIRNATKREFWRCAQRFTCMRDTVK